MDFRGVIMTENKTLLDRTADIVAAQAGQRPMSPKEITDLINTVYDALKSHGAQVPGNAQAVAESSNVVSMPNMAAYDAPKDATANAAPVPAPARQEPAVPVEKSVASDYIICLEDGKKMTMLKRYLKRVHNLTPEEYRAKWGLPDDYPMTAPSYSKQKSQYAKAQGLGQHAREANEA